MRLRLLALVMAMASVAVAPLGALDRTQPPPTEPRGSTPTLKVYSRETFVDVTVVDDHGRPVHGLTRDDFTILEDNHPVSPNSFAEHRTDLSEPMPPAVREALPANTFTNAEAAPGDGPVNILLLDSSNTPVMTQHVVQTQMLQFVERMRPGTRMAVLRLTYHLSILQGITTDRELVRAALASDKTTPGDFAIEDNGQDKMHTDGPVLVLPNSPADQDTGGSTDGAHAQIRAEYYLTAMNQLANFLSGMPGRKNLIWFTGFAPGGSFSDHLASETDLLARAHVTISAIYTGGGSKLAEAEKIAMTDMAEQTGGHFYQGGGAAVVEQILDLGSNFYAFTYVPTEKAVTSGQFRNITVKINRPGLHLAYRPGYYATDPSRSLKGLKLPPRATAMQAAMERGGLQPTQILFHVKLDPDSEVSGVQSAANQPDRKRMKPPFRSIAVSYSIDIGSIAFRKDAAGLYRGEFEFGVMVYNADGQLINTVSKQVRPVLASAAYESMVKHGAQAHLQVDVPARGDFNLRVGVHDLSSDRVGALEVPISAIAMASGQKP